MSDDNRTFYTLSPQQDKSFLANFLRRDEGCKVEHVGTIALGPSLHGHGDRICEIICRAIDATPQALRVVGAEVVSVAEASRPPQKST